MFSTARKTWLAATAGAALLTLTLTACGGMSEVEAPPAKAAATAEAPVAEDTTPEPVAEAAAEPKGTFKDPFVFGTPVGTDDLAVTLGAVEVDGVTEAVKAANEFNEDAPAGTAYVRVPVTLTNTGTEKVTPWLAVTVTLVAQTGESFDNVLLAEGSGASLGSLTDVADLYEGGTGTGYLYFAVDPAALPTMVFNVAELISFSDGVFVKAV